MAFEEGTIERKHRDAILAATELEKEEMRLAGLDYLVGANESDVENIVKTALDDFRGRKFDLNNFTDKFSNNPFLAVSRLKLENCYVAINKAGKERIQELIKKYTKKGWADTGIHLSKKVYVFRRSGRR